MSKVAPDGNNSARGKGGSVGYHLLEVSLRGCACCGRVCTTVDVLDHINDTEGELAPSGPLNDGCLRIRHRCGDSIDIGLREAGRVLGIIPRREPWRPAVQLADRGRVVGIGHVLDKQPARFGIGCILWNAEAPTANVR